MQTPHIAIVHTTRFPRETFAEFERLVEAPQLEFQVEERDEGGPFAGIEWLLPTAVILFLGKSYFDGFLKEMGKDHYALLKAAFKTVYAKLIGPASPEVKIISTKGKSLENHSYSLNYSVLAELGPNLRLKLLIQNGASQVEYERTISAFLEFASSFHAGTLDPSMTRELSKARVMGGTVLVAYDAESSQLEFIDPIPKAANI